jgi:hypothetical protein
VPTVREAAVVSLDPEAAERLWTDIGRWPTFVDGFARVLEPESQGSWPEQGAKVVWESGPNGRGRVTERVTSRGDRVLRTEVYEQQLTGTQTVAFELHDAGALVSIELDYRLAGGGPLRRLTDVLFIRRALADALARTLRRFATEAADEASL